MRCASLCAFVLLVTGAARAGEGDLAPFQAEQSWSQARIPTLSEAEMASVRRRAQREASVAAWIQSVEALKGRVDSPLLKALKNPASPESQLYAEYIRYVSHRRNQEKVGTATSRMSGLSDFEATGAMDGIMTRLTELGESIPEKTCERLSHLIQGGAFRVQAKADTFLLNKQVRALNKIKDLIAAKQLTVRKLDAVLQGLIRMDGTSALSIKSKSFGAPSTSRALALPRTTALMTRNERESLVHVTEQLPESHKALQRMSQAIESLSPTDPAFVPKVQLYKTYANHAVYNAEDILRTHGALDRLAEAAVEIGDAEASRRLSDFLTQGMHDLYDVINNERHTRIPRRLVWFKTLQTVRERGRWDRESLGFVLDQFEAIAKMDPTDDFLPEAGQAWMDKLEKFRKSEPINTDALKAFIAGPEKEATVRIGAIDYDLGKVAAADGSETLEVRKTKHMPGYSQLGGTGTELEEAKIAFEKTAAWNPDLTEFRAFLTDAGARSKHVRIGHYTVYFRKAALDGKNLRLTLADIYADAGMVGSGHYADLLQRIEQEAGRHDVKSLLIETVRDRRQQRFYETKMGYGRAPGYADPAPSYLKDLSGSPAGCDPTGGLVQTLRKYFPY